MKKRRAIGKGERPMKNDDILMSMLEQAEIVARAWTDSLPVPSTTEGTGCHSQEVLRTYASGAAGAEQALAVASHLGICRNCRQTARRWRILQDAEQGVGTCSLDMLRKIMAEDPDSAARALARVSRRLADMVNPLPLEQEPRRDIEAALLGPKGELLGESVPVIVERHPVIDSRYYLRLRIRAVGSSGAGCRLRVSLKDSRGKIEVGSVVLEEGSTTAAVDLSDLCIKPGFMSVESMEIMAERVNECTESLPSAGVKTSPRMAPGLSPGEMIGRTMTKDQLADVRTAKQRPRTGKQVCNKPAPKGPAGRRKMTDGDERE